MLLLINTTSPYTRVARIALWEKGFADVATRIVDPWADAPEHLAANPAARVPTLILDDGQALSESLLIVLWLERTRPEPSLLGADPTGTLARAGLATGVIDAAAHTIISRRFAGADFDETPVGLRRRRSMATGLRRLDAVADRMGADLIGAEPPDLAAIAAVVALDYVRLRFAAADWLPALPGLDRLRARLRGRPSIERTMPYL